VRSRVTLASLAIALAGGTGVLAGLMIDPTATAFAYLVAYAFGFSLAIGALLLSMIETTSGARWFVAFRRIAEIAAATMPLMVLLFVPVLIAMSALYPWAHPLESLSEEMRSRVEHTRPWLNAPFFTLRAALYFGLWIAVGELLLHWSLHQREDVERTTLRLRRLSAGGIWLVALTLSGAALDWFMSLAPAWPSTAFSIHFFSGSVAAASALVMLSAFLLESKGALGASLKPDHYHAIGRIELTFLMFWAYVEFVQLLIIWMGDLPDEADYYLLRFEHPWSVLGWVVLIGGFFVPFLALLSRALKRNRFLLAAVSVVLLAGRYADLAYIILPEDRRGHESMLWVNAASMCFVLGMLTAFGSARLRGKTAMATGDPLIAIALRYESP
jgi:hypothetical protein